MHSVKITLIADQEIRLLGNTINIHDIESIIVNGAGEIISYYERTECGIAVKAPPAEALNDCLCCKK